MSETSRALAAAAAALRAQMGDELRELRERVAARRKVISEHAYENALERWALEDDAAEEREAIQVTDAPRQDSAGGAGLSPGVFVITDHAARPGKLSGGPFAEKTRSFRRVTARRYAAKAKAREAELEAAGATAVAFAAAGEDELAVEAHKRAAYLFRSARWYRQHELAEEERPERVDACGSYAFAMKCEPDRHGCGSEDVQRHRCSHGKLCTPCRARSAALARHRFGQGRMALIERAAKRGLLRRRRLGGRWSEKLLTLTVPHVDASTYSREIGREYGDERREVVMRIALLLDAWRTFSIELRRWAKASRMFQGVPIAWHRSFEWTPGHDGNGHPHLHLVVFAPFMPRETLTLWWRKALRSSGYVGDVEPIEPDIREIKTAPEEIARELHKGNGARLRLVGRGAQDVFDYACGWSIAEWAEGEQRASDAAIARLYEALHARRLTQSSIGFLPPRGEGCAECGALRAISIRRLVGDPSEHEDAADERAAIRCDGHTAGRGPPSPRCLPGGL